jgi:hypothetical protein
MGSIHTIIEHIEIISWWRGWEPTCHRNTGIEEDMTRKGNKKGNIWGQSSDFRRPPPGVVEPRGWCVGAPIHLSNLLLRSSEPNAT